MCCSAESENGAMKAVTVTFDEFGDFWTLYPRKVGKLAAQKAYATARRIASAADIRDGVLHYPFSIEPKYQPHAATWLNAGNWLIEADTPPPTVIVSAGESEMARFDRMLGEPDTIDQEGRLI